MITAAGFVVAAMVGSVLRHVGRVAVPFVGPVPTGTVAVNLIGSFALGLLAGWDPPGATIAGMAGLGALTTFSTFSAEVTELRAAGAHWTAVYVAVSVLGGVGLAWCGLRIA